jgi:hypothetical protein
MPKAKKKSLPKLVRRYGHAPVKADFAEQGITFAPWVADLLKGEAKSWCLYETVQAALIARHSALTSNGDKKLIAKADASINAIGSGKIRSNRTACKTAASALRKYVQSWGGSKIEIDSYMP